VKVTLQNADQQRQTTQVDHENHASGGVIVRTPGATAGARRGRDPGAARGCLGSPALQRAS
jgi:hypothetical protein